MSHVRVLVVLTFLALAFNVYAKTGYGPGEQDWGHVEVRKGAHMFYWLYQTTADVANYTDRPLVIWLQGGPGASSTGFGNFAEFGPLDVNGNYRNYTWVKDVNVLFIDNPVGSGFSYVENNILLTKNNKEIALDLVEFMKGFYAKHPEFESVPLHIFCECYGGKMAPEFAWELYNAIQRKELKSNLTSIGLGDSFTSPIDSVLNWAPFLLYMGIVDEDGYSKIMTEANKTLSLVEQEEWNDATNQCHLTHSVLAKESYGVNSYNVEKPTSVVDNFESMLVDTSNYQDYLHSHLVEYKVEDNEGLKLKTLMRGPVSEALGIPTNVRWGSQRLDTSLALSSDLLKPVVHIVNKLLDETNLTVAVYTGQLDLICPTAGAVQWVKKLQWKHRDEYVNAKRQPISVNGILEGYEKSAKNLFMFWVNRAGHMVPLDNPSAMSHILKKITNYD